MIALRRLITVLGSFVLSASLMILRAQQPLKTETARPPEKALLKCRRVFATFGVSYDNNHAVLIRPGLTFYFNRHGRTGAD